MPREKLTPLLALLLICAAAVSAVSIDRAEARTVTWLRAADAQTLDPHAIDDGVALSLTQQIYEPLIQRDAQGKTSGAIADSWSLTGDPLVWEIRLRRNVTFHEGEPLTSADVEFSIERARGQHSGVRGLLSAIERVTIVDSHTLHIRTSVPTPLLPGQLTHVLIMSKAWSEKNGARQVAEPAQRHRAYTARNANGTGPFFLVSREMGTRTVLRRNESYWGNTQTPVEITELIYRPIPNDTERVQTLVSGEGDFLQDVPVNELPRLQAIKTLTVSTGPENRTVFLGFNVGPTPPGDSGIAGANPLADRRVREAISAAINRQHIQRTILLGQAIPTGTIAPPSINGYPRQLDRIPQQDPARGKVLLAELGLPNGFRVKLDCPRDGITRGEAICRSIATQLAAIGITVEPVIRDVAGHLDHVRRSPPVSDFFLTSLTVPSFDSEQLLANWFHTRGDRLGRLNATHYSNAELDRLIASLSGQTDFQTRIQAIAAAWRIAQEEMIYVPLHVQTIAYVTKSDLTINVDIENQPKLRAARVKTTIQ